MGTVVELRIVSVDADGEPERAEAAMDRAFHAFRQVEDACSRFDPDSELQTLCRQIGEPVRVSPFLFEPLRFAVALAQETDGAFDPTVGGRMELLGFDRHYLTGDRSLTAHVPSSAATYRDIELNEQMRTVRLRKPVLLDLGAVAKGFAVDLAAEELRSFPGFLINAGGDLYAGGCDADGGKWRIGIQHPTLPAQVIDTVELSDAALCTSGSYNRKLADNPAVHHLLHPHTGRSASDWVSCSVIAPYAMLADSFATAAFVLGEPAGKQLVLDAGLSGIFITEDLTIVRAEAPTSP